MPALGIRPAISLSLKLLTFRWGKIARFALSGVKSTSCWLCAAFFWGVISDIFFRLFFLWYQRDALCTQIFGCEVETVLMLKGGFCLWDRPPLILRDIQAVSPATYEYGGTVPAFRFFSRHEVSESAHSVHFIFLSFFICFFLGIMPFSTRWVLFSFSFFVLSFPQDSRIRLSLSLAGNGRKVCLVALCSCASLCIAFRLAVCFFVSSPSLFVCLQDGGYGVFFSFFSQDPIPGSGEI